MRRPRHKLEVSTFPFLAVLLCAMGSLILFLLVMDRRAKLVARNKAREVYAERLSKRDAERQAQQAELDRRRLEIHRALADQREQLAGAVQAVQKELADAGQRLDAQQTGYLELAQQIGKEKEKIRKTEQALTQGRAGVDDCQKLEGKARTELEQLARDVRQLEIALQGLRARKQQEHKTYSLVPYHGKHGAERKPIYLECTRSSLIFHPGRVVLEGPQLTVANLRAEVERRAGTLVRERPGGYRGREPKPAVPHPYVLFLVRPDGSEGYHTAQAALDGFEIDFGYELIDADWALNFDADPLPSSVPPPAGLVRQGSTPRAPGALMVAPLGSGTIGPASAPGTPGAHTGLGGSGGTWTGAAAGVPGSGPGNGGAAGDRWMKASSPGTAGPASAPGAPGAHTGLGGTGSGGTWTGAAAGVPGSGPGNGGPGGDPWVTPSSPGTPGAYPGGAGTGGSPGGTGSGGAAGAPSVLGLGSPLGGSGGPGGTPSILGLGGPAGAGSSTGGPALPGGSGAAGPGSSPGGGGPGGAPSVLGFGAPTGLGSSVPGAPLGGGNGGPGGIPSLPTFGASRGAGAPTGGPLLPGATAGSQGISGPGGPGGTPPVAGLGAPVGSSTSTGGPQLPGMTAANGPRGPGTRNGSPGAGNPSGSGTPGSGNTDPWVPVPVSQRGTGAQGQDTSPPGGGTYVAGPGGTAAQPSTPTPGQPQVLPPGTLVVNTSPNPGQPPADGQAVPPTWEGAPPSTVVAGRGSGGGGEPDPLGRFAAPALVADKDRAPKRPPPLGRLIGNRDFVILVDCHADHATVLPGGAQFRWPVQQSAAADQALTRYVQQLIERRQASVRPGEPPYRPQIRFQVAPDGLRTYYRAYPPLEPLRVPMSRENLEE